MAFGLLAQQTKLGVWPTLGLSVFVFAGAAQFMAVSMMAGGAAAAVIVSTAFIVNFRHVLMSASLSPMLVSWGKLQRTALGWMLTDESFALHSVYFAGGDVEPAPAIALNVTAYLSWAAAGMAGYRLGALIESPETWGVDFALPAMFIGLLIPTCKNRPAVTAALCGGGASVALHLSGAGSWAAFLGALVGATAGTLAWGDDS
jgi:4-azaleucine resistance transporter AzlC